MINNSYKLLFFFSMITGSLISLSSTSWFGMWMGLEINLLSFIPLMMNKKNLFSSESSLKYFFTQALASTILLFSILTFLIFLNFNFLMNFLNINYFVMLMSSTLLMKMGCAPFHFWFPSVMEGMTWNSAFFLMTWQKIAPMMILSYMIFLNFLVFTIIFSVLFGSLGGLNQTSLRKLMAFSSITHLGWMLTSLINNEMLWMIYFLFYCFLNLNITLMLNLMKINNLNQTFFMKKMNFMFSVMIFFSLLSLGGLPPFLGFFPKWILIEMLTFKKMFILLNFLIFFSLISLFFYLRISFNSLMMSNNEMNWNFKILKTKKFSKFLIFLNFVNFFGLLIISLFFYFI